MELGERRTAGMTKAAWLVLILVILALVSLVAPIIRKQRGAADCEQAMEHALKISRMLSDFDRDYGRYPDDETALEVKKATGTNLTLTGSFSNDYFRQMLVSCRGAREDSFWCRTDLSPKKPDEDFSTPAKALAAGEVGYSYIMASATRGQKAYDDPGRPVVVAPSYKFRADWTFDAEPWSGSKAMVLFVDGRVIPWQVRGDNRKLPCPDGKVMDDTGADTPWGTKMTPCLRAPKPR